MLRRPTRSHGFSISPDASAAEATSFLHIDLRPSARIAVALITWNVALAVLVLGTATAPVALRLLAVAALTLLVAQPLTLAVLCRGGGAIRSLDLLEPVDGAGNRWRIQLRDDRQYLVCVQRSSASLGPVAWIVLRGPGLRRVAIVDERAVGAAQFRALRRWLRLAPPARFGPAAPGEGSAEGDSARL